MNNFKEARPTIDLGIVPIIESCMEVRMMGIEDENVSNEDLFREYCSTFIKLPRLTGKTTAIIDAYRLLKHKYDVKLIVPKYIDKLFVGYSMGGIEADYNLLTGYDAFETETYRRTAADIFLVDEYKRIESMWEKNCWYDLFLKADKPMIFGIGT